MTVDFPSVGQDIPEQCKAENCNSALVPNFAVKTRNVKGLSRTGLVSWCLAGSLCEPFSIPVAELVSVGLD